MSNKETLQSNLKKMDEATKGVKAFLKTFVDEGSFVETDVFACGKSFIDGSDALGEGIVSGYAAINGSPVQIFAQNADVMKGSISAAHAEKIVKCFERAVSTGTPVISVIDSCGARVGEGVAMLEGYAKIIAAAVKAESEIPHLCVIKGTSVGMMSSFAALADFVFMSEKATLSAAAPATLSALEKDYVAPAKIIGYKNHSQSDTAASFGYADEKDLKAKLCAVLSLVNGEEDSQDDPNRETPALNKTINADNLLKAVCDDGKYTEYCADFAKDVKCVLTKINGVSCALTLNINGSVIGGAELEKMTEFAGKANAFGFPVINFVDSEGLVADLKEETAGLAAKAAAYMAQIADASVPRISVICGKALGFAYTAFASKGIGFDYTLAFADAKIAAVDADAAVNVIYLDELKKAKNSAEIRQKLAEKYEKEIANPFVSAKDGFVDNIIMPSAIRPYLASALLMLMGI